ncbi:hypothetical protein [Soonwooa purpurea]
MSAGISLESGIVKPTDSRHRFVNYDFVGKGRSISGGEGSVSGTYGGNFNRNYKGYEIIDQFNPENFGRNSSDNRAGYTTESLGVGRSLKGGIPVMWTASQTWVFGK